MIVHATKQAAMDYLMNKGPSKPKAKSAAEPRETKPKTKQIGDGIFDFRVPKPARVGQKIQTLVPTMKTSFVWVEMGAALLGSRQGHRRWK